VSVVAGQAEPRRGTLILVVGASGAGKDSLIAWCKVQFAGNAGIVFPRRAITRVMTDGSEDHDTISESAFDEGARNGAFALHWRAHGLRYGIPASVAADLAEGRSVVTNVSRAVLDEARRRFPPVTVVSVTVPRDVLLQRLHNRSREVEEDIAGRLARSGEYLVEGPDVIAIDNSGTIAAAGAALAEVIAARSR
jgi:ribose 1,5-bisphosphokinase